MNLFARQKQRHRCREQTYGHQGGKVAGVGWRHGGMNWEIGIDIYTLICIKQITNKNLLYKKIKQGFPGGAVVENLPVNAEDMGSSPGLGRSHMLRNNQAHEPQLLSLQVWSLCSATREAAIVRGLRTAMKSGPHLPQLEKALAQKRRPSTAINK